jgi:chemotaxis response regulator CheB
VVLTQDAASSGVFSMPASAIATGAVDRVLPIGAIGDVLCVLVRTGRIKERDAPTTAS